MHKPSIILSFAIPLLLLGTVFQLGACSKDQDDPPQQTNCDVQGNYSDTYTNQLNLTGNFAYKLTDDNFAVSAEAIQDDPTAFGSYRNTCDSLILRSWNSINENYYYFAGKFSSDRTVITGIYKNLTTTSETGTFTLTKQ